MQLSASDQHLSYVIGQIYDAAIEPLRWPDAIAGMCGLVGSFFGSITTYDTRAGTFRFLARWGGDPWWNGELDRKYADMMPFASILDRFELGQPFNLSMAAARIGGTDIWKGEFAQEWAHPAGVGDSASVVLHRTGHLLASMGLATRSDRGPVGEKELEIIGLLAPHVRRALMIGDLVESRDVVVGTLQGVLDALHMAVIVVDSQSRICHTNRAAMQLLDRRFPLATEHGHLIACGEPETRVALRAAVERAGGGADPNRPLEESVPLRLADGSPAMAHVLAIARGRLRLGAAPGTVVIFVSTPSDLRQSPIDALAGLYGLTSAESRLLGQLSRGLNRNQAATELAIADSTAKTHLDRIFLKTGTSSQSELHRLIISLSAPVQSP